MADQTELRMNLAAVKRTDPYAAEIVETSAHVAFYTFNYEDNEWEKTDVEGAFFVYRRTAEPFHSIFINNRLNTESLVEPVTADLELQAQPPFLLYRNERSRIRGFWFYNKDELERVATLVNKLVKECQQKQQQLTTGPTAAAATAQPPPFMGNFQMNGGEAKTNAPVNIFSMLSKAQNEFDQSINNNNNNTMKMIPPMQHPQQQQQARHPTQPPKDVGLLAALLPKMNVNGGGGNGSAPGAPGKDAVTSQSVMNFFASAAKPTPQMPAAAPVQHHPHHPHHPAHHPPQPVPMQVLHSNGAQNGAGGGGGGAGGGLNGASPAPPPLLQRLMSNPVHTVEQIEMQHRAVTPQAQPEQQPAKENGFNWKATTTTTAGKSGEVAAAKGEAAAAAVKNGKDEMWPALLQQPKGGAKGANNNNNKQGAEVVKEKEKAVANGNVRKGQPAKTQGGGGGGGVVTTPGGNAGAAAAASKPALMTPTMFKKAEPLSKVDPTNPSLIPSGGKREAVVAGGGGKGKVVASGAAVVDLEIKPEPLTQSQMLQAMTYLMKTDAEFMRKLHEAYVKSFAEMMAP